MEKIIGILIIMLLFLTTILPLISSVEINDNRHMFSTTYVDDCDYCLNDINDRLFTKKELPKDPNYIVPTQNIIGVPDYFNWKDFGGQDWTTFVKDQGSCGCCYIFAALGIIENIINIKEGSATIDIDLSEQYVLSCLPNSAYTPGSGCSGGEESWVLQLIMATTPEGNYHNGIIPEECFPYEGDDSITCENKCPDWDDELIPITDTLQWYPTGSEDDIQMIKSQIMEKGSLTACMDSTVNFQNWMLSNHNPDDYYPYEEGTTINHVVNIVGWKDDNSVERGGYWICKNSWGTNPGYNGFFNIEYGSLKIDSSLINWVEYDPESYEWDNEPNPPNEPTITGETNGDVRTDYEYTFIAFDPDGNAVRYFISWGDGNWEWTEYYPSGKDVTVKHTYRNIGNYSVVSLAMNTEDSIGSWGTLEISMPKNREMNLYDSLILRLIKQFPVFQTLL